MPLILVTNDDGYRSEGIRALATALRAIGDVTIVAPLDEASAIGHALTLRRPLRLEHVEPTASTASTARRPTASTSPSPRSSERLPDLVVSGINKGWNLGDDVTYSGTVAGAIEGALLGMQGIAVSLRQTRGDYDFTHAARAAAALAEALLRAAAAGADVSQHQRAARASRRGSASRCRRGGITSRRSPSGTIRRGGRISGSRKGRTTGSRTIGRTTRWCATGYVSVTPLHCDLTAHDALRAVEELALHSEESGNRVIG